MAITVRHEHGNQYSVTVSDPRGSSVHTVTVWPSDIDHYAPGADPDALLEAAFEFLLEREPPSSILPKFELPVIERYFPEFRAAMSSRVW